MRKYLLIAGLLGFTYACSNGCNSSSSSSSTPSDTSSSATASNSGTPANYDSLRGVGKFTNVEIAATIDDKMAAGGQHIYELKCSSCHKLTTEKLVGPGWKGVTTRRRPEWIMNFVTNTDEMINKDPHAQAMLEICMVRMPNQNLADQDARNVLEFMRKNDQSK